MKKKMHVLTVVILILTIISSVAGMVSVNFTKAYDIVNQYGQTVKMYGYGIYAHDTYFQAPISIGTDVCIFFLVVPMLLVAHNHFVKDRNTVSRLKLITVYAVILYYAVSLSFGLTYNRLFLVYAALFSCSLFGLFRQMYDLKIEKAVTCTTGMKFFLVISGIALVVAWLPDIIPTLIHGGTLSIIGVYTTCITYVLDMGILCPICFISLYLLKKGEPLGTILLAVMLKLCIVVGVMVISQTVFQILSGCDVPLVALITKSLSFVLLGGFACYFNKKMYESFGDMR
ncbi:MAG: hypothetical protein PUD20_06785 [bacterium]|nr:hypothetical protein [bacterium]